MRKQQKRSEATHPSDGPVVPPQDISERDILCGKDKQCIDHPGSKHFKAVIDTYAERYSHCISKYQKMVLTKEIYEKMSNQSSRFLKQQQDGSWTVISVAHIRDKIGHALRFANKKAKNAAGFRKGKTAKKKTPEQAQNGVNILEHPSPAVLSDSDATMATTSSQYSCSSISGSGKRERPPTSFPTPMPPAPSSLMMQYDMQFPSQLKLKRSQHPAPHQVPSSVSFAKGPSSKHQQSNIMHQLEIPDPAPVIGQKNHINTVSLQDDDIFLMLREPLVDFDPHASNANIVQL